MFVETRVGSTSAAYNGLFSTHRFEGGELVKTTCIEPYRSQNEAAR